MATNPRMILKTFKNVVFTPMGKYCFNSLQGNTIAANVKQKDRNPPTFPYNVPPNAVINNRKNIAETIIRSLEDIT